MRRGEGAAPRPRPLSGGLWTLVSWLRGAERGSSDSLSSAGSARTAASFAFVQPPRRAGAAPPPPAPPTDSYRRRLRDRSLRRLHDRDLTLRRKYGLFREGYDAFSLPPARRTEGDLSDRQERDRRAASEGSPRQHVPGKRRAPPPPPPPAAALTRRPARKRPAPQPPTASVTMNPTKPQKENKMNDTRNMNPRSSSDVRPQSTGEYHYILDCKLEKYSKKEESPKESKPRVEKSFIKQLFESKKRNSTVETKKILPNISELDKQATEIIESCKLKPLEQQNNFIKNNASSSNSNTTTWFCTMCLRKYDSSVITCRYCLPDKTKVSLHATAVSDNYIKSGPSSDVSKNKINEIRGEEKQKLKEMLKEMKDSLPKKHKSDNFNGANRHKSNNGQLMTGNIEPATLRIGFAPDKPNEKVTLLPSVKPLASEIKTSTVFTEELENRPGLHRMAETVVVTQPVVLIAPQLNSNPCKKGLEKNTAASSSTEDPRILEKPKPNGLINHTPVKLSSLLNPVYIPKHNVPNEALSNCLNANKKPQLELKINTQVAEKDSMVDNFKNNSKQDIAINTEGIKRVLQNTANTANKENKTNIVLKKSIPSTTTPDGSANSSKLSECNMIRLSAAQHSRRRELINQLEQSIAKGDERSAADAAMKLAQLKLSCAVLSFSSQIAAETSGSLAKTIQESVPGSSSSKLNVVSSDKNPIEKINLPPNKVTDTKNPTPTAKQDIQEYKTDLEKRNLTPLSEPSTSSQIEDNNLMTTIEVWVEDREATRGPVRLEVPRRACLGELRRRAAARLGLAARLQRWVVGRTLCQDDSAPLLSLAGPRLAEPFYLCLVESETIGVSTSQYTAEATSATSENAKNTSVGDKISSQGDKTGNVYSELMQLEQRALVANVEPFQCVVCLEECGSGEGAVLRECVHTFCRECLAEMVKHCEEPAVACPALGCPGALQEREIRALVSPEDYEKWLARGLATAESGTRNAFHCRTRDCTGWALCDPGVHRFPCPVCKKTNCVPCKAIHEGKTCEQHRKELEQAAEKPNVTQTDEGTQSLLDTLIKKGEALECPECSAIITKKWGCDWVKCSACKTEICWVTRGRRWGPAGRGDTSAGCRCGVDGKRCHPSCGYCH